jgi:cold shock CspA family protein
VSATTPAAAFAGSQRGTVATFDDDKGFGTVRPEGRADGGGGDGDELFFHCTAIADGTRTIEVGTPVTFEVVPGRLGRWEATHLTPRS